MNFKKIFSHLLVGFIFLSVLTGCGGDTDTNGSQTSDDGITTTPNASQTSDDSITTTPNENTLPIVDAGENKTVIVNESVTLYGSGSDSEGSVNFEWKKGNTVLGTSATLIYIPTIVGTDVLTLTVIDDDGATASDSVNIIVKDVSEQETEDLPDFGEKK